MAGWPIDSVRPLLASQGRIFQNVAIAHGADQALSRPIIPATRKSMLRISASLMTDPVERRTVRIGRGSQGAMSLWPGARIIVLQERGG